MKKEVTLFTLFILILVTGCGSAGKQAANGSGHQQVTAVEAKQLIDSGKVTVIDVRTAEEFQGGHIAGAQLLPLQELESRLKELDKKQSYLLVCRSGSRSAQAQDILKKNGFASTYNMEGGMSKWPYEVER